MSLLKTAARRSALTGLSQVRTSWVYAHYYAPPEKIESISDRLIYRDKKFLALNKPFGMAVHSGPGVKNDLTVLLHKLRLGNRIVPHIVHRLDVGTTGVLLLSRDVDAARLGMSWFKERKIRKVYRCLVLGRPANDEGTIDVPLVTAKSEIAHEERSNYVTRAKVGSNVGMKAVSKYRLVEHFPGPNGSFSLLEVEPVTGQNHQIRAHCCDVLKCPIVGDHMRAPHKLYSPSHLKGLQAKRAHLPLIRIHLHAAELHLPPDEEAGYTEPLVIAAPLSAHFERSLNWIRQKHWHSSSAPIIDHAYGVEGVTKQKKRTKVMRDGFDPKKPQDNTKDTIDRIN